MRNTGNFMKSHSSNNSKLYYTFKHHLRKNIFPDTHSHSPSRQSKSKLNKKNKFNHLAYKIYSLDLKDNSSADCSWAMIRYRIESKHDFIPSNFEKQRRRRYDMIVGKVLQLQHSHPQTALPSLINYNNLTPLSDLSVLSPHSLLICCRKPATVFYIPDSMRYLYQPVDNLQASEDKKSKQQSYWANMSEEEKLRNMFSKKQKYHRKTFVPGMTLKCHPSIKTTSSAASTHIRHRPIAKHNQQNYYIPSGYICNICGIPGHLKQHCKYKHDTSYKRTKFATGMPKTFLKQYRDNTASMTDDSPTTTNNENRYMTSNGNFVQFHVELFEPTRIDAFK